MFYEAVHHNAAIEDFFVNPQTISHIFYVVLQNRRLWFIKNQAGPLFESEKNEILSHFNVQSVYFIEALDIHDIVDSYFSKEKILQIKSTNDIKLIYASFYNSTSETALDSVQRFVAENLKLPFWLVKSMYENHENSIHQNFDEEIEEESELIALEDLDNL